MKYDVPTIAALKSGDIQAFQNIYHTYYKGLCVFCTKYVSQCEAEEIVQETFIWLWEKRETLNEQLSLKGLLLTIVKNKTWNCLHRADIHQRAIQKLLDSYTEEFELPDFDEKKELFERYQRAISKLSPEILETFKMHRFQNLTYKEIAYRQGCSLQTINYRISRAMKILKNELL